MSIIAPNTMRTFTYGGVTSSTYFYTIEIGRSVLPPISVESISVPQRHGAYPVRSTMGVRTIPITVQLIQDNWTDLRIVIREIASWLFKDEDRMLTFSDEPNIYYLARVEGSTDLDELLYSGETTITFLISDPIGYDVTEKNQLQNDIQGEPTIVTNSGTFKTYPRIRVVPTVDGQTYFRLSNGTEYVYVNGPFTAWTDIFIIDCNTNSVYMESNGARIMNRVDISSDFFALEVGENSLIVDPTTGFSYRVYWRERYL